MIDTSIRSFAGFCQWQSAGMEQQGNLLRPCQIRDHNKELRQLIQMKGAIPIDVNAATAILDPVYATGLDEYENEYCWIADPILEKVYLKKVQFGDDEVEEIVHQSEL
jgi:hypothetical protein